MGNCFLFQLPSEPWPGRLLSLHRARAARVPALRSGGFCFPWLQVNIAPRKVEDNGFLLALFTSSLLLVLDPFTKCLETEGKSVQNPSKTHVWLDFPAFQATASLAPALRGKPPARGTWRWSARASAAACSLRTAGNGPPGKIRLRPRKGPDDFQKEPEVKEFGGERPHKAG